MNGLESAEFDVRECAFGCFELYLATSRASVVIKTDGLARAMADSASLEASLEVEETTVVCVGVFVATLLDEFCGPSLDGSDSHDKSSRPNKTLATSR